MKKYLQPRAEKGNTDTVPAMLTPGEFIIRKDAVDEIGIDKLHALNNVDRLSDMSALTNYRPAQFQEGGEVMNYYGGGMVRNKRAQYQEGGVVEALEAFGEKSKSADEITALIALKQAQSAAATGFQQGGLAQPMAQGLAQPMAQGMAQPMAQGLAQPMAQGLAQPMARGRMAPPMARGRAPVSRSLGLQQGGMVPQQSLPPAGFMQEGGEVKQPMPIGESAGMQDLPLPEGERAYPEEPRDQLNLEDHEYAAYLKHGPDVYKYLAPKYKPKIEWTPYEAMVDAGAINPYEVDKNDFVVMTRDMASSLRGE